MKKKKDLFPNIIGYQNEKKTLERIIDVLNNKEKYQKLGSSIPHGLFLYGPPGLGKTTFMNELLHYVENRKCYIIRKIKSDGDFIQYMYDIFQEAKKTQPSIILLDDIDKFSEVDEDTLNHEEFVSLQSFIDDVKNDDIFIVATANDKSVLPRSLLRSGRFDIKMKIDYPKEDDAFLIFQYYLKKKKIDSNINVQNISSILGNASCADLEKVCNQAAIYAGYNNKDAIGMDELLRSSLEFAYDTNIEEESKENKYSLYTAYHEAGHAVVGEILEPSSVSFITTYRTNSETKGFTKFHNNEYYYEDINFMENRIISLLAGKASIEIVFHKCDTGCNSDLDRAYKIAERFVDNYCMLDFHSWIRDIHEQSELVKENKDVHINKMIDYYYQQAKEILISNRDKLDKLAYELNTCKILFQDQIDKILNPID